MKKIILTCCAGIFSLVSYSQDLKEVKLPEGTIVQNTVVIDGVTTHNYASPNKIPVNGTPFLNKKFEQALIQLKDGKKSGVVFMRYNIAKDQFEIKHNNDTLIVNQPHDIRYILMDNKKYIYDPHFLKQEEEIIRNGYLEVIKEGEMSLFLKRNKKLNYDSFVSNYGGGGGTKEYYYVDRTAYFAQLAGEPPFKVTNPKSFVKNIDAHKNQLKEYIKSNKVKFKKESDISRFVDYYNSL